jgi:uncharacterized repeat protein (TIGR01451 family)
MTSSLSIRAPGELGRGKTRAYAVRVFLGAVFSLLSLACSVSTARAACDSAIWGIDASGNAYTFTPPTATATRATGSPTLTFGTIARGIWSGYIYTTSLTAPNATLSAYNPATNTKTTVGTFTNTTQLYASAFGPDGVAYVMSSSEVFSFTDATTPTITKLGAPSTTSGPAMSAYNGGDIAVDQTNTGWIILSSTTSTQSYLYQISFGTTATSLTRAAQITLGGTAYKTADLYSLAFGADGNLYAAAANSGTLYQVNETTGALTSVGAQGVDLQDFASCPFQALTSVTKTGPSKSAAGELVSYSITAANSTSAHANAPPLTLTDPVPAGITLLNEACAVAGGAVCGTPAVAGQTVSVAISTLPPGGSATLTIHGQNASLPVGTTTNTATLATSLGTFTNASASTTVVANLLGKTVANITQGIAASTSVKAVPSDVIEYVLTYTNYTNAPLYGFAVSDTIPANSSYVASSAACVTVPPGATCTPSGPTAGVLSWAFTGTPLATGATISVKFRATVN